MKVQTFVFTALAALVTLATGSPHSSSSVSARHVRLAHRAQSNASHARGLKKRCQHHPNKAIAVTDAAKLVTPVATAPVVEPAPTKAPLQYNVNSGGANAPDVASHVIKVDSKCGPTGAKEKTTATSGPNGDISWLNCGLTDGGWNPPFVRVDDLVTVDLQSALARPHNAFEACRSYVSLFEKYGKRYGVQPIMLAAFAMQESSCNPHAVGGGGEQGLMQITRDKCDGAPGGNCKEPDFNIRTAAAFFSSILKSNGGNVLASLGHYNGWHKGLTRAQATAAAHTGCCRCQNNLDYLHQFVNGWLQNINAQDAVPRLGKYFNLDIC
ncbi:hypothetical protein AX17_001446 [Amanita inopinata Kibby_2008]|nr:hypothetical protein AX17_001446 [Amanita inopinata Kibby_2008]